VRLLRPVRARAGRHAPQQSVRCFDAAIIGMCARAAASVLAAHSWADALLCALCSVACVVLHTKRVPRLRSVKLFSLSCSARSQRTRKATSTLHAPPRVPSTRAAGSRLHPRTRRCRRSSRHRAAPARRRRRARPTSWAQRGRFARWGSAVTQRVPTPSAPTTGAPVLCRDRCAAQKNRRRCAAGRAAAARVQLSDVTRRAAITLARRPSPPPPPGSLLKTVHPDKGGEAAQFLLARVCACAAPAHSQRACITRGCVVSLMPSGSRCRFRAGAKCAAGGAAGLGARLAARVGLAPRVRHQQRVLQRESCTADGHSDTLN
jgi:hypothetical protein